MKKRKYPNRQFKGPAKVGTFMSEPLLVRSESSGWVPFKAGCGVMHDFYGGGVVLEDQTEQNQYIRIRLDIGYDLRKTVHPSHCVMKPNAKDERHGK